MILRGWLNVQTGEQRLAEFNKGFKPLAFSGIHCINPRIFDKIKRKGKFSIMEEYLDLMHTEEIHGYEHQAHLVDVGRPESIWWLKIFLNKRMSKINRGKGTTKEITGPAFEIDQKVQKSFKEKTWDETITKDSWMVFKIMRLNLQMVTKS